MSTGVAEPLPRIPLSGLKQAVVFLLLFNFALYAREDWLAATDLFGSGAGFLDWTGAFATTLDEASWFVLLFLFEFELRRLSRRAGDGPLPRLIWAGRALCCLVIAHTLFSNVREVQELLAESAAAPSDLRLAWLALAENVAWLAIILLLLLDERAVAAGRAGGLRAVRSALKLAGYGVLLFAAAYWAGAGHYLYAWDELLWVGAFGGLDLDFRRLRLGRFAAGA